MTVLPGGCVLPWAGGEALLVPKPLSTRTVGTTIRATVVNPIPSGGTDTLRIRLLGDLQVQRADGSPIALPASRRTRALLGFLVATAASQLRSALCDLLWEGPDDPRASLRWSLTKLRPVVDGPDTRRLVADRDHVAFDPRACE